MIDREASLINLIVTGKNYNTQQQWEHYALEELHDYVIVCSVMQSVIHVEHVRIVLYMGHTQTCTHCAGSPGD